MLPTRPFRTLLPVAFALLLGGLVACGGAPSSAGLDGSDAGGVLSPSGDASGGEGGSIVVVARDAATSQPADAGTMAPQDAGAAEAVDSATVTSADAAPDEGLDVEPEAAADVSTPDAPVVDVQVVDAQVVDAVVVDAVVVDAHAVEAGPVCTSAQLLCGGACVAIDTSNCGTCGHACPDGETCQADACACPSGETLCGSACTNESSDGANCGTCGHACTGGETCESGTCTCPSGQTFCGNSCTTVSTDGANCGTCGHACTGGETCQSGTCACPSGETLCGATCVNESSDSSNCGACGHGCLGGTCSGGMCQPVILATPGGSVENVATDGTYVYWTSNASNGAGSVGKCEITSCAATATSLATGLDTVSPIALDPVAGRVFFGDIPLGNAVGLWYTPTTGGAAKSWGPNIGQVDAIWIASSVVYYWTGRNGGVYLSNGAGTYIGNVMTGDCLYGVASDSSHVYAADNCGGRLLSCPVGSVCGSSPDVVATGIAGPFKLYDDGSVLWLTAVGTTIDSYADGALYKCSPTSCSVFASAQAGAQGVVSDGTNVYWTDAAGGAVMRSATGTAAPLKIAPAVDPGGLAQTTTAILWGSQTDGSVYLLAK